MSVVLMNRYPMYSSLIENEEGRRISGQFQLQKDVPEHVNAHAATLWECCLLKNHYDVSVVKAVRELGEKKNMRKEESWREMLKKDFGHKIFTIKRVTKAKEKKGDSEEEDEEDIDELIDNAFGSDSEDEKLCVCS